VVHQYSGYSQRAIRNKEFKLIWSPQTERDYYLDVLMDAKSNKFFAKAWKGWAEKAKTDPDAQAKIDRVLKHPEFELYDINKDPWELENLANNPEYSQKLEEMHAQLQAEMERLGDAFSAADAKKDKRERKAQAEQAAQSEKKERRRDRRNK
jgi:arylsulfatase A-like enzyme